MLCPSCGSTNLPGAESCQRCQLSMTSFDGVSAVDIFDSSLIKDSIAILDPKPPVTIFATTTLEIAIETMMSHGVGALLVVNDFSKLIGVLTERDFLTKIAGTPAYEDKHVRDFMTNDPETVKLADPLAFAVRKMADGGYRHLPVVDDENRPIGVVSVRDVLTHLMALCGDSK